MQNLGIWRLLETGKNSSSNVPYLEFAYSLCTCYGATMMIKDSLVLSPHFKHFQFTNNNNNNTTTYKAP